MQIKEAKIFFTLGHIKEASIVEYYLDARQWNLLLTLKSKDRQVLLSRHRGGECIYKTIDAAFSAARKIGFKKVTINVSLSSKTQ